MKNDNFLMERMRKAQERELESAPIYTSELLNVLSAYLKKNDIEKARKMFTCHAEEAMNAISEFVPKFHKINERENKVRIDKPEYEVNKLPRCIQRVTNNTGTFFMFANSLKFTLGNSSEETNELQPYFDIFKDFLKKHYFDERMYEARRITGAETECAKEYVHYKNPNGKIEILCRLLSNGNGKTLYTLFDEYGKMMAFATGYFLRNTDFNTEEHFDVYTTQYIWRFVKNDQYTQTGNWNTIEKKKNVFGKIPIIYYHHETDWEGAQPRIERLEWVDSKRGDTNEYFGDPYLLITADIAQNRLAEAKAVGKVIVMDDENGRFEFVAPPDCGDMINDEKEDLKTSIEEDTLTPDWSYKSIMGLSVVTGEVMRRANLAGYVKRANFAVRIYNELIRREINLIIAILCNYVYLNEPKIQEGLRRLKIEFRYTDPFQGGIDDNSTEIATLVGAGAMSIRAAVEANRFIDDKDAEYERIWQEKERMAIIEAKAAAQAKKTEE